LIILELERINPIVKQFDFHITKQINTLNLPATMKTIKSS